MNIRVWSKGHFYLNMAVIYFGQLPIVGEVLWWAFEQWQYWLPEEC